MVKKIIILTDQISDIGGINSLIYLKANYWVNNYDHEVHIITTEQKAKPLFYNMDSKIVIHDLGINFNRKKSYFGFKNLVKIFINYARLQSKIKIIQPDVIIVANHIPVTYFFPILITKAKFVKEFHFSKFFISKKKITIFKKIENYLESKFDILVVLNAEERTFYNNKNVVTIPNPIKIDFKQEPTYAHRKNIAMAAGRMSQVKRFDVLIDLWSDFVKLKKDWKLEIYGDGDSDYVAALNKKIESLHLSEFIEIKKSTNQLKDKMLVNGLYLMTSEMECLPMVLLEAQSCGLPIIAYDCPTGPRNIITQEVDGVLVEFDNKELFVKKMVELTSNQSKRAIFAKNGYINAQKYNLDNIMAIWNTKIINKA
jgi:glycosyltransferase involved in cell wall biosynthesis